MVGRAHLRVAGGREDSESATRDPFAGVSKSSDRVWPLAPSVDGKGHSAEIRTRAMPVLGAMVDEVVESRAYPEFASRGDVGRSGLVMILEAIANESGDERRLQILRQQQAYARTERRVAEVKAQSKFVVDGAEALRIAAEGRDWVIVGEQLDDIEELLEMSGEVREPYRSQMNETVRRYRDELKRVKEMERERERERKQVTQDDE